MGGMGRFALYNKARFGTKQLIVDYIDEVVAALEHLAEHDLPGLHDLAARALGIKIEIEVIKAALASCRR